MELIYANSQCASIYYQLFDVNSGKAKAGINEYMYVEMAHYTDDDTIVLICVTPLNEYEIHEYKLDKSKDKDWEYIMDRYCCGNSNDQILSNIETLFISLEFSMMIQRIYKEIFNKTFNPENPNDMDYFGSQHSSSEKIIDSELEEPDS